MLRHAARAIPWPRIVLAGALVVVLVELVRWDPWVLWPLEGTAVGLLGGATAWCFDEAAAAVTDTTPRGLAWKTAARAPGVLLLAGTWTAVVLHAGDRALLGHAGAVLVQGFAAMAGCAGLAVVSRGRGSATPGLAIATAVVPVTTAWALVRPLGRYVPVFPYGDSSAAAWRASTAGWAGLAAAAAAVVTVVLTEVRRQRRDPGTPVRPARSGSAQHAGHCPSVLGGHLPPGGDAEGTSGPTVGLACAPRRP